MNTLRALIVALVFVVAFAAVSASADKSWLQVRSQHFAVVTDMGEKHGSEIARRCEQMRAAFSLLMDRATTTDPAPLVIVAVNGQKEVEDLLNGGRSQSRHAGVFLQGFDQSFILIDASQDPWPTVFHEYAHEFLNANAVANVATWFEEGFAEYFSTFEYRAGKFELGRVPVRELQFLRSNGKLMRMADLNSVNRDSEIYNRNGPSQELFYAESWLLVHYLFDHQLIGRAQPFFALLAAGTPLNDATRKSFGMSTEKLESELLDYARGEKFRYFSLPASQEIHREETTATNLTAVTVAALEAEVRWHGKADHSKQEAEEYASQYGALLAREPGNADALRGLGLAMLELHDYDSSLEYLKQALSAAPDEANHHALSLLWAAAPELQAEFSPEK